MDPIKIGKFIALNRKKMNMTQVQLGEKIGINGKTISRWETGKYMPDISFLIPLSEALQISVHELLLGEYIEEKDIVNKANESIKTIVTISENKTRRISYFYMNAIILFVMAVLFAYFREVLAPRG